MKTKAIRIPKPARQTPSLRPLPRFAVTRRSRPDNKFCESVLIPAASADMAELTYAANRGSTVQRMKEIYFITVEEFKG